jgi:hypothetical protein
MKARSGVAGTVLSFGAWAALAGPAAADWHKSYVFDWFAPAFYYGADEGVANPGTDCPLGTMPDSDWAKMLKQPWRPIEEVTKIMDPEGPSRQRDGGLRGPSRDISIYAQPWTAPDPGAVEVTGTLAHGFNLDGDESTGFTSPDGAVKGIDNQYYKAIGCFGTWRGPPREGHHAKYVIEGMHNGNFAMVMVVSGEGDDPANDPTATVGIYMSRDKMVRDANGGIAGGYSFRVNPEGLQAIIPAKTVNGVIETREPSFINIRSIDNVPMKIEEARISFKIKEDGSLEGYIGGYRSVDDLYRELAGGAATFELTMRMDTPAVWYALQRHADYKPLANGEMSMMSMAYHYLGKPAHVVLPDSSGPLTVARLVEPQAARPVAEAGGARLTPASQTSPAGARAPGVAAN